MLCRAILCIIALDAAIPVGRCGDGASPQIAIVATAAAQAGLADVLTAELAKEPGLAIVERQEIGRVVDELTLAAIQSADAATELKLGGLLAADAMVFIEREPKAQPPQVRLRVIEVKTGIRLGDWPVPAAGINAGGMADVRACLRLAVATLTIPPADRHLVGMIGPTTGAAWLARLETLVRWAELVRDFYEHCARDPKLATRSGGSPPNASSRRSSRARCAADRDRSTCRRDSQNEVPHRVDLATSAITPLPNYVRDALPYADQRNPGWTIFAALLFTGQGARDASGATHGWSPGAECRGDSVHPVGDELVFFDSSVGRLRVIRKRRPAAAPDRAQDVPSSRV